MQSAAKGELAVVTGAAGGLGACFAQKLAQRGYRLLLIDRRAEQLRQTCDAINARYGAVATPCSVDLCQRAEVESLAGQLNQTPDLALLVNNAGFGTTDYFVDIDVSQHLDMIHLHVLTPVMLARAALPGMIERNRGAIINVSSLGAWSHSAGNVQYAATKTYLAVFSQALEQELQGTNVRVQALCPGFVRTEFHDAQGMKGFDLGQVPAQYWMSAEEVVECSLRELAGKRVVVFPGLRYRILGRLMQMPLFQPLVRRMARTQRRAARRLRRAQRAGVLPAGQQTAPEPANPAARS